MASSTNVHVRLCLPGFMHGGDDPVFIDMHLAPTATAGEVYRALCSPDNAGPQGVWESTLVQGSTLVYHMTIVSSPTLVYPTALVSSLEVNDAGVALVQWARYDFQNDAERNRYLEEWSDIFVS